MGLGNNNSKSPAGSGATPEGRSDLTGEDFGGQAHEEKVAAKLAHWQDEVSRASRITDGLAKPIDAGILPLVVALNVNGCPTAGSCEGHLEKGNYKPYLIVGERAPSFELWYPGQETALGDALAKVRVPLQIRIEHFKEIGFGPLTVEIYQKMDTPEMRVAFRHFHAAVRDAYDQCKGCAPRNPDGSLINRPEIVEQRARTVLY